MLKPIRLISFAALLLMAHPALAEERKLNGAEIEAALTDHTFRGDDRGKVTEQIFQKGGSTYYSVDGNQSQGIWRVTGDQYCSKWPPSDSWACYDVTVDGETLTFISGTKTRYPVTQIN
jgi:hypothetical protein